MTVACVVLSLVLLALCLLQAFMTGLETGGDRFGPMHLTGLETDDSSLLQAGFGQMSEVTQLSSDVSPQVHYTVRPQFHKAQPKHRASAIVVGGGLAGLYAARMLYQHGIHNISILEKESQLGGKIKTEMRSASGDLCDAFSPWEDCYPFELGAIQMYSHSAQLARTLGFRCDANVMEERARAVTHEHQQADTHTHTHGLVSHWEPLLLTVSNGSDDLHVNTIYSRIASSTSAAVGIRLAQTVIRYFGTEGFLTWPPAVNDSDRSSLSKPCTEFLAQNGLEDAQMLVRLSHTPLWFH